MAGAEWITLPRARACCACRAQLRPGQRAWHEPARRAVTCPDCRATPGRTPEAATARAAPSSVAARLAELVKGKGVVLLCDRRVAPGRGGDGHLAVGPGGVTVIAATALHGAVRAHAGALHIAGRDRSRLLDALERQLGALHVALVARTDVPVHGALCLPNATGVPTFGHVMVRGVLVDGPRAVARLAARSGPLDADDVDKVARMLARLFPPAAR
jgi:hypothetical protein